MLFRSIKTKHRGAGCVRRNNNNNNIDSAVSLSLKKLGCVCVCQRVSCRVVVVCFSACHAAAGPSAARSVGVHVIVGCFGASAPQSGGGRLQGGVACITPLVEEHVSSFCLRGKMRRLCHQEGSGYTETPHQCWQETTTDITMLKTQAFNN